MKYTRALIALALSFALFAPAAFAQPVQKPMTEKELSKLIEDWPAVNKWFEDRAQKISSSPEGNIPAALFMNKDFESFIAKRGWTMERFSYVVGTSFSLLYIVAIEKQNPEVVKQFDDAIAQIEASESPADEKAEMIKSLNEAKASMLAVSTGKDINQAELRLVRARYAEILKISGSNLKK